MVSRKQPQAETDDCVCDDTKYCVPETSAADEMRRRRRRVAVVVGELPEGQRVVEEAVGEAAVVEAAAAAGQVEAGSGGSGGGVGRVERQGPSGRRQQRRHPAQGEWQRPLHDDVGGVLHLVGVVAHHGGGGHHPVAVAVVARRHDVGKPDGRRRDSILGRGI